MDRVVGHGREVDVERSRVLPLEAIFYFHVQTLWIHPGVRARSYSFPRAGYQVALDFPSGYDSFGPIGSDTVTPDRRNDPVMRPVPRSRGPGLQPYGIDELRVRVRYDAEFSGREPAGLDQAENTVHLERALLVATGVAGRFLGWVRTFNRQWWLGLTSDPVKLRESRLVRRDNGEVLGTLPPRASEPELPDDPGENVLNAKVMQEIVARMLVDSDQPPPDILLADAHVLAERHRRGQQANLQQALLLAAIACEVKVKHTLEDRTSVEQRPLLRALLERAGGRQLFGQIVKAALGRSLQEENPQLHRGIGELFEERNKVAHRGHIPSDERAHHLIAAAAEAFRWLEALPRVVPEAESEPSIWWSDLAEVTPDDRHVEPEPPPEWWDEDDEEPGEWEADLSLDLDRSSGQ